MSGVLAVFPSVRHSQTMQWKAPPSMPMSQARFCHRLWTTWPWSKTLRVRKRCFLRCVLPFLIRRYVARGHHFSLTISEGWMMS